LFVWQSRPWHTLAILFVLAIALTWLLSLGQVAGSSFFAQSPTASPLRTPASVPGALPVSPGYAASPTTVALLVAGLLLLAILAASLLARWSEPGLGE
jgi:hypothetical protein